MPVQNVNLLGPIKSATAGVAPLFINIAVTSNSEYTEGGPTASFEKNEQYVRLSSLPPDLQRKVVDAVKVLLSGQ